MYYIKSIVLDQYHKTDTGIISKWQINNTFSDTFYDDINKDRVWHKNEWFFLIKFIFCFSLSHHLEKLWSLNIIILYAEYTKRSKGKSEFLKVWYRIVSYRIGIVLSVLLLYRIIKK